MSGAFFLDPFSTPAADTLGRLSEARIPFVITGGYVRDRLLGRESPDIDIGAFAGADAVLQATGGELSRCLAGDIIRLPNCDIIVAESPDDLAARGDFTCNAMQLDKKGELRDPCGGCGDIVKGSLRMISPSAISGNPGNILRGCRFLAQFGWSVEPATEKAFRRTASCLSARSFLDVHARKSWIELRKAARLGILPEYLELLRAFGMLKAAFPPLFRIWMNSPGNFSGLAENFGDSENPDVFLEGIVREKLGGEDADLFLDMAKWRKFRMEKP